MLATVNPCGFAMLPAYLSYFLGIETGRRARRRRRRHASPAPWPSASPCRSASCSVFTVIGAIVRAGGDVLIDWAKYVTIPIGLALAGLGVAMVLGYHLPFTTPRLDKGGRDRTVVSMFVFGVSYAIASIGCTLPLFIGAALTSFTTRGTVSGVLLVLTYGAGMALVLTALTVTLALARGGLLAGLRRVLPYVDRVAGVFLVLAGLYLVYYWIFNLRFDATGSTTGGGLVSTVEGWSFDTQAWLQDRGGWVLGTLLVARRRRHRRACRWPAAGSGTVLVAVSDGPAFAELLAHARRGGGDGGAQPLRVHGLPRRVAGGDDRRHRPGRGRAGRARPTTACTSPRTCSGTCRRPRSTRPCRRRSPGSSTTSTSSSPSTASAARASGPRCCSAGRTGSWPTTSAATCGRPCRPTRSPPTSSGCRSRCGACTPATRSTCPASGGVQIELPPRVRGQSPIWWDWDGPGLTPHTNALIDGLATAAATWPLWTDCDAARRRPHGERRSTVQPVARAAVAQPVVQAAGPALPELDLVGLDPVAARPTAAPARRRPGSGPRPRPAPPAARPGRAAPSTAATPTTPAGSSGAGWRSTPPPRRAEGHDRPAQPHLAVQLQPAEHQRRRPGGRRAARP